MNIDFTNTKEKFNVNGDNCGVVTMTNRDSNRFVRSITKQLTQGAEVFRNPKTNNLCVKIRLNNKWVAIPVVTNIFEAIAFGNPPKGYKNMIVDFTNVDENDDHTKMYCVLGCEAA